MDLLLLAARLVMEAAAVLQVSAVALLVTLIGWHPAAAPVSTTRALTVVLTHLGPCGPCPC